MFLYKELLFNFFNEEGLGSKNNNEEKHLMLGYELNKIIFILQLASAARQSLVEAISSFIRSSLSLQ